MKNEFLSVVSHELRTPLTSIRGSLGLLAGGRLGELPERAASLVDIAVQNSERLTRLINDLLDIERIESGRRADGAERRTTRVTCSTPRPTRSRAWPRSLGRAGADRVGGGTGPRRRGPDHPDADEPARQRHQVLRARLGRSGSTLEPTGAEVHFRVSDDGRGIPADKLETIFDRFEQVDSSDSRQKGGTGLGLTISRGIVERHGGRIWVESELGVGTTVHFTLPAASRAERRHRPTPARTPRPSWCATTTREWSSTFCDAAARPRLPTDRRHRRGRRS